MAKLFTLNIHKEYAQLVLLLKSFLDICTSIFAHWLNSFIYWLKWHDDFTEIFIFTYFFMRRKDFFFSKRMKTIQTLKIILICVLLSCHVCVSEWIHPFSTVRNAHSYAPYKYVLTTQLSRLVSLAKWLSVRLWTKWLWLRVQLQSLNHPYVLKLFHVIMEIISWLQDDAIFLSSFGIIKRIIYFLSAELYFEI